jgi:hypothetical protein
MSTAPNLEFAFDFSEFNNDMAAVARQKELEQQAEVARRVSASTKPLDRHASRHCLFTLMSDRFFNCVQSMLAIARRQCLLCLAKRLTLWPCIQLLLKPTRAFFDSDSIFLIRSINNFHVLHSSRAHHIGPGKQQQTSRKAKKKNSLKEQRAMAYMDRSDAKQAVDRRRQNLHNRVKHQ